MSMEVGRSEIVFFDVETTIPSRKGQKFAILEFGAILVSRKLVELESFCTLVRPDNISAISEATTKCNGITRQAVEEAPKFQDVADRVYDLLHGRVWAGHNIICFDCVRIREAFAEIGRQGPEAKGFIDSLRLLRTKFGRRAGNLKMATLADYFGLGSQKHRSLDDVRMNLEVIRYCATVLFLEENYPDVFIAEVDSAAVEYEMSAVSASTSCGQGRASNDEKLGKPMKNKSPVNTGVKNFSNVSNKETKEVLKASVQKRKQKSNTCDKEMKGVSNESVKVINSEVNKGTLDIAKIFDSLQSYWSQPQALQDENVGVLSDPSNPITASVTEQSEIIESECFLEPPEDYPDVLIVEMASTATESEISSVSVDRCGQGKASTDEKLRKSTKKTLLVNNGVKNFSNVSNKETKEVLKASVQDRKEISNTSDREMEGVSNESIKVISSEVNKGTLDITKLCDSLQSVWSQPQALQDGDIGVLSDSSNPIAVSVTESSKIRESESFLEPHESFLEPHEVCSSFLRTAFVPTKWGTEKMILTYKDQPLQMNTRKMMIRFGISKKYFAPTGKPKLSFVVEPSLETCEILKVCDNIAQRLYSECNGNSEWRPLITTKQGLVNTMPAVRMHIASVGSGGSATYCTELYWKNSTGPEEKLAYTSVDIDELDDLFRSGRFVDADYSFDIYDYLRSAGIRLVARRLTVDCR